MPCAIIYCFHTIQPPNLLKVLIRQVNYFLNLGRRPSLPGPRLRGRYNWLSNARNVTLTDILLVPTITKDPVVRSIAIVIVQGDHVPCRPTRTRSEPLWRLRSQCGSSCFTCTFPIFYLEPDVIIYVHIPKAVFFVLP